MNIQKRIFASVIVVLVATLAGSQSAPESFDSFYSRFKNAVAQKDEAALQKMMTPRFDFLITPNVSPSTAFNAMDDDNGQLWTNLQTAIQQGSPSSQAYGGKPSRLLWCTPSEVIYNCYVVFQKDKSNAWRWRAFVMPQK